MSGKLIIFSAPSGAGKTTIVKHLLNKKFRLEFSISACTRAPRPNEINGKDYYFISVDEFQKKIKENAFLEWEEVYSGCYYGTLKSEVDRITEQGNNVLFDVDVMGGLNIKKLYKEKALALFIMPPSIQVLEERLKGRHTEDINTINKRIEKANHELTFAPQFDHIIINDKLEAAIDETTLLLSEFLDIHKA